MVTQKLGTQIMETQILRRGGGRDGKRNAGADGYEDMDAVEMVTKKTRIELDKSMRDGKRELEQSQARIKKLDEIIQRLYEDNIEGKISDERFTR